MRTLAFLLLLSPTAVRAAGPAAQPSRDTLHYFHHDAMKCVAYGHELHTDAEGRETVKLLLKFDAMNTRIVKALQNGGAKIELFRKDCRSYLAGEVATQNKGVAQTIGQHSGALQAAVKEAHDAETAIYDSYNKSHDYQKLTALLRRRPNENGNTCVTRVDGNTTLWVQYVPQLDALASSLCKKDNPAYDDALKSFVRTVNAVELH